MVLFSAVICMLCSRSLKALRLDSTAMTCLNRSARAHREKPDAGIQVEREIAFGAAQCDFRQAIDQEAVHLEERVPAHLESGILDRTGDADRLQAREQ